jgi:hypothetical protein
MLGVDAIVCDYSMAMSELFMSFNKSLIVYAVTRYEHGRETPEKWNKWNENLKKVRSFYELLKFRSPVTLKTLFSQIITMKQNTFTISQI